VQSIKSEIIKNIRVADEYFILIVKNKQLAKKIKPGQFFSIRVISDGFDPLLGRPISVFDVNGDEISFLYKISGRGTEILSKQKEGIFLTTIGPLGNGFDVNSDAENIALIGGGVGMPPLYYLAKYYSNKNITFFYGGRSKEHILFLDNWYNLANVKLVLTTDDGTIGDRGMVITPYERYLKDGGFDMVFACGPTPMLKAIDTLSLQYKQSGQISLEARMACGVGACLACVCPTVDGGKKRICADGPAFSFGELSWS